MHLLILKLTAIFGCGLGLVICGDSLAQQPSLAEVASCTGEAAKTPFCRDQKQVADLQGKYALEHAELAKVTDPPWTLERMSEAEQYSQEAQQLINDQYFGDAIPKLTEARKILAALKSDFESALETEKLRAEELRAAGKFEEAQIIYQKLMTWRPEDEAFSQSLQAMAGQRQIETILNSAERKLDNGEPVNAQAELRKIQPKDRDARWSRLNERIEGPRRESRFQNNVSKGMEHVDASRFEEALQAFDAALKIKPRSNLVSELREDVQLRIRNRDLKQLQAAYGDAVTDEDWFRAEEVLIEILPRIANPIQEENQLLQVRERIEYEGQLDRLLATEESSISSRQRKEMQLVLANRPDLELGTRISQKTNQLTALLQVWTQPIAVTIQSDGKTEVKIRPGSPLGKFERKKIQALPGSYRISGIRSGYREVVHEIELVPNQEPFTLTVICRERF